LPTEAPWVVVGPGENAGVVDIGDGWLAALRIESHNHPSFVEPYQGAATGVGGILRDVFTMGARPIALWDQIRFGSLDDPHNRYLFNGVVKGVAGYGNAVGVPTVGGEVEFDDCYAGNPLVNVMCLGILKQEQLVLGTAGPPGSIAVLLGASTGRDGIGGASVLASATFDDTSSDKRPSVQVGDPFEEKKLIEACLELYDKGLVVGVQDLGAAGLSCALAEPAARAGVGMTVDLDAVHTREPGMTPAELLMSESQERMMAFVEPSNVAAVQTVATKWEITSRVVGEVEAGDTLTMRANGEVVARIPAATLSENAPLLHRPIARPDSIDAVWANTLVHETPPGVMDIFRALLADPNVGDPSWVYQQYDHMLFLNTIVEPGHDASMLRIKGTKKGLSVSTDGNGRICELDPRRGSELVVWEAALNVALTGAKPIAAVDNLNFGNPEKPEIMWQFSESVDGLSQACRDMGIPVVGGNVSFYNATDDVDIHPTPVVGMLGLADPVPVTPPKTNGAKPGDDLWLFGPSGSTNLSGSITERVVFDHLGGRPTRADASVGSAVIAIALVIAQEGLGHAVHDISDGGLAVAASEMAIASNIGVHVAYEDWRTLFSEDPHRFLAAIPVRHVPAIVERAAAIGTEAIRVGAFGGDRIVFGDRTVFGDGTVCGDGIVFDESSDGTASEGAASKSAAYEGIELGDAAEIWRGAIRDRMV